MADEHQNWLARGFILINHKRYSQAEVELGRALGGDVDRAFAFYLLAWTQSKQGKFAEAEETAGRCIAEDPKSGQGYEVLSMVLERRGRLVEAEKATRSALACRPQSANYRGDLAWILRRQGRPEEALTVVEEALREDPLLVRLHIIRTGALIDLQRWDDAKASALHALSLNPEESGSRRQLGDIAFGQKDYTAARKHYAGALRLDPNDAYTRTRFLNALRYSFWYYRVLQPGDSGGGKAGIEMLWPVMAGAAVAAVRVPAVLAVALALSLLIWLFLAVRWFLRITVAPVTTLRLRFHPIARALISPDEIECSDYVAMLTVGAVLAFGAALWGAGGISVVLSGAGVLFLILIVSVTKTFQATGIRRTLREAYSWLLLTVGSLGIVALTSARYPLGFAALSVCVVGAVKAEAVTDALHSIIAGARGKEDRTNA